MYPKPYLCLRRVPAPMRGMYPQTRCTSTPQCLPRHASRPPWPVHLHASRLLLLLQLLHVALQGLHRTLGTALGRGCSGLAGGEHLCAGGGGGGEGGAWL